MPELPEVEITARRLTRGLVGRAHRVGAGARDQRAQDVRPAARRARRPRARGRPADRQDAGARGGRPDAAHPPDVGRPAAALRHARLAPRPRVAGARAARGRPRAAPAGVRDAAAGLGEAAALGRGRRRRRGRRPRPRRVPGAAAPRSSRGCSTSPATSTRCCATSARSPASAARGSTSCSGPPGCRPSRRARTWTRRSSRRSAPPATRCWAGRSTTTRTSSETPFLTSCRCHCRSTAAPARTARAAAARIEAIHFKDYVMCYCPEEQTGGRVLKDRRLSRLLK